jgi:hypothetical protein
MYITKNISLPRQTKQLEQARSKENDRKNTPKTKVSENEFQYIKALSTSGSRHNNVLLPKNTYKIKREIKSTMAQLTCY